MFRQEVLLLELTARGLPSGMGISDLLAWCSLAREAIVRGFADLTSDGVQALWERER